MRIYSSWSGCDDAGRRQVALATEVAGGVAVVRLRWSSSWSRVVVIVADADCDFCRLLGYRSCDVCGGVVLSSTLDVCGYCVRPAGGAGATKSPLHCELPDGSTGGPSS